MALASDIWRGTSAQRAARPLLHLTSRSDDPGTDSRRILSTKLSRGSLLIHSGDEKTISQTPRKSKSGKNCSVNTDIHITILATAPCSGRTRLMLSPAAVYAPGRQSQSARGMDLATGQPSWPLQSVMEHTHVHTYSDRTESPGGQRRDMTSSDQLRRHSRLANVQIKS